MSEVFIISAVRSPVGLGKPSGGLVSIAPVDLTALILQEAARRAKIEPGQVEDVVWGCVTPIGDQGANLARLGVLRAGFPPHVPAVTLNRMCGSSQQAIHFAAQAILAGDMDLVIAGGTEMMSHQPLGADYPKEWPQGIPYRLVHQGISAEMMAEKYHLSRQELDDYAYQSHLRAMHAIQNGIFDDQILPITLFDGSATSLF
jgi:acetyl-CoA acyltransferase